ncbi:MAG: hypothetical protein AAGB12_01760 [Pseudomonadota bacterium]
MIWMILRCLVLIPLTVVGMLALFLWVYPGGPATPYVGTPEYYAAYGFVPGQSNTLLLGKTLLTLPPGPRYTFESSTKTIEKGKASKVLFRMDFSHLLGIAEDALPHQRKYVRVRLFYAGPINRNEHDLRLSPEQWHRVIDREDWGLWEFHRAGFRTGWGYLSFQAKDGQVEIPVNGALHFRCAGMEDNRHDYSQCWGGMQMQHNLRFWFFVPKALMPHWQVVYETILKNIQGFVVQIH